MPQHLHTLISQLQPNTQWVRPRPNMLYAWLSTIVFTRRLGSRSPNGTRTAPGHQQHFTRRLNIKLRQRGILFLRSYRILRQAAGTRGSLWEATKPMCWCLGCLYIRAIDQLNKAPTEYQPVHSNRSAPEQSCLPKLCYSIAVDNNLGTSLCVLGGGPR